MYHAAELLIIFVAALLVRLLVYWSEPMIARDGIYYLRLADNWSNINSIYVSKPMLFVYLIKVIHECGIPIFYAGLGINLVCGALLPVVGYLQVQIFSREKVLAWCVAAILIVHPSLCELSKEILRESSYLLFSSLAVLLLTFSFLRCRWMFPVAGLTMATAAMTRWEGWASLMCSILALIICYHMEKRAMLLDIFMYFSGFGIGTVLLSLLVQQPLHELLNFLLQTI